MVALTAVGSCEPLPALLKEHGRNTTSYLMLEPDKQIFWSAAGDAAIAYLRAGSVAVVQGEPLCADEQLESVIAEFEAFCRRTRLRPLFFEVSEWTLPAFASRGYRFLKTGEEPFIELDTFTLAGNRMANVRSSASTARRRGVSVRLHDPLAPGSAWTNARLQEISDEWLAERGALRELSFTLGTLSLANPGERRYFVAEQEGRAIAFLTFAPIYSRSGMYLDLMRRAADCPPGTMDLLLSEAFVQLAALGYERATMGMAPLANIEQAAWAQDARLVKLLCYAREHGAALYNFEALRRFKQKFCPQRWESKYLAYRRLGWAELNALCWALEGAGLPALLQQAAAGHDWWRRGGQWAASIAAAALGLLGISG
ncbi:bifunctional lysylphosphatidylglycerol flippase/synthetase MprF [Gloeobacter kilaueensis]|uniref:Lysyl-tRNA synthetase n=1 Tax=Gloeobacter kilaueensis (strain ATCC BAA-2537 / CCAP 1431/1 / ULC 316 / JS1) TaxID=1183438 RepID=U5QIW8_GLOK1|nr:phosphatidylglycerol lysyltransferase domain-containing protein [Gloeobacter kilaueensis]AGY57574.1 lysyl-tRNA synthetase [Gloeobacter kilaueensis JS1]